MAARHLLAVACEVERLQTVAVRTTAVIGHWTSEVRATDNQSRLVTASELEGAIVLVIVTDDDVFCRCTLLIASDVDMAYRGVAVTLGGDADVHARTLDSSKHQTGGVELVVQHEVTSITTTVGVVAITGAAHQRQQQS